MKGQVPNQASDLSFSFVDPSDELAYETHDQESDLCFSSLVGDMGRDGTPPVSRFAPSPTGRMHAGNIFASLVTWLLTHKCGGSVVLRIEDLDRDRSKQHFIDLAMSDYEMLGLTWDDGPYFQRDRDAFYERSYDLLNERGLVYPCFCTRADLHAISAPHLGQMVVYPGYCRDLAPDEIAQKTNEALKAGRLGPSYRIRVPHPGDTLDKQGFFDVFQGNCSFSLAADSGDFVIRRSDLAFAYQLAVVLDDADQGITLVTRGIDLLDSVPRQRYLQSLLGLRHPLYAHIPLLVAPDGRRLAKRNHDAGVDALIDRFKTPEGILGHIAGITGISSTCEPQSLEELLEKFNPDALRHQWQGRISIPWR